MLFCCFCCCCFSVPSPRQYFPKTCNRILFVQLILAVFCFFLTLTRYASFSNFKRSLDLIRLTPFLSCIALWYFQVFCLCARYVIMISHFRCICALNWAVCAMQTNWFIQSVTWCCCCCYRCCQHIHFNAMHASHVEYFVNPPLISSNWYEYTTRKNGIRNLDDARMQCTTLKSKLNCFRKEENIENCAIKIHSHSLILFMEHKC